MKVQGGVVIGKVRDIPRPDRRMVVTRWPMIAEIHTFATTEKDNTYEYVGINGD